MLGDMVGAAGCDGGGNAMMMGANKMFNAAPAAAGAAAAMGHMDPMMDELADAEHVGIGPMGAAEAAWGDEFMAMGGAQMHAGPMGAPQMPMGAAEAAPADWANEMMMQPEQGEGDWAQQFQERHAGDEWAEDFASAEVQTFGIEGEVPLSYEEKLGQSESVHHLETERTAGREGDWVNEFAAGQEDWAQEFMNGMGGEDWAEQMRQQMGGDEFEGGMDDWAEQYANFMQPKPQGYQFEENNPYMFHENPYEEGLELLQAGTLSEAVLAFEATVQKNPEHADAWQHLGTTNAANEKDRQAIAALIKARELQPLNPDVLQQLGASFTNESMYDEATGALVDWITNHPQHGEFAKKALAVSELGEGLQAIGGPEDVEEMHRDYYGSNPKAHANAAKLFEAVAGRSGDPEVHAQLGVLYNMSRDYDRAAMHFEAALSKGKEGEPKLWNRLGATRANGGQHQQAVIAYNRAIDLNPGFVRAQFNLGISLSSLDDNEGAARQFLRALDMQQSQSSKQAAAGEGGGGPHVGSGAMEIWDALRMTLSKMGRNDLYELTWKGDASAFNSHFSLDPFADTSQW